MYRDSECRTYGTPIIYWVHIFFFLMVCLCYCILWSSLIGCGILVDAMELSDILPDRFNYDKMRPPRLEGQPAKVFNHLTVMGLDSINENSMVSQFAFIM